MALSSLALGISVLIQGVPASHWTGFKTASELRLFGFKSPIQFHIVPFTATYTERAEHVSRAGARNAEGDILHWAKLVETNSGREESDR